jgi:hypothetical protein
MSVTIATLGFTFRPLFKQAEHTASLTGVATPLFKTETGGSHVKGTWKQTICHVFYLIPSNPCSGLKCLKSQPDYRCSIKQYLEELNNLNH